MPSAPSYRMREGCTWIYPLPLQPRRVIEWSPLPPDGRSFAPGLENHRINLTFLRAAVGGDGKRPVLPSL